MICETCSYKRQPWSKDLAKEGYIGCSLLLHKSMSEEDYINGIDAEVIAFGWITNGHMATADQPVLLTVRTCSHRYS